ncbi:MAG: hypothetical protein PUK75_07855 [bacterium]|nr:hypothetical protein [bacterium]MDY4099652.1 hypothetical protein [Lachnospiraceae bacterium]
MTGKKEKTISGAMYSAPNLEHNLRTHIPPNSVEERRHLNWVYTKDSEITLQQVYEKLFAKPYKEWRDREIKKGRGKRFPPTYYEKIEQDKQKHLCYEIIWQIGDMRDTGFVYTPDDANRAQDLLDEFAKYLLELPEVCVVTQKELDDPSWKPPFDAGLIVHHMVYHGDENSPHIHMTYIPYTTNSSKGAPIQNAFAQTFKDLGYPTTMRQAVTETGDLVWQKDEDGNLKPQMKRDRYGGADWVETQKAVLQDMMLKEFGWERFYKGSNPRGNLILSDYRREKAAEMAKEEERKLENIKDKVATGQATIQAQAEQMEAMLESLDKGAEAERQLSIRITDKHSELDDVLRNLADKSTELDEVKQDLTDKKSEVREQEQKLSLIKEDADETIQKAKFAEELIDYFRNTNFGDREKAYFEKMLDLKYENECLKQENQELKAENRSLRAKLEKAYDFMRRFTINGMNMLEHFLRSIGEWVQQKVAGMSR